MKKKQYITYAENVTKGKIVACQKVKQSCKRFLLDLDRIKNDSNFSYYFDYEEVDNILNFIHSLTLSDGRFSGQKIVLGDWQAFIICNLYGFKHKETKRRRYRKAYISVGRKNGKTTLMAILMILHLLRDKGGEVYSVATSRQQAGIAFEACTKLVKTNPELSDIIEVYKTGLVYKKNLSTLKALSSDYGRHDGKNPSFVLCDEVAAYKDSRIIDVMKSGMVMREEPLLVQITTSNFINDSPGKLEYDYSAQLLNGQFTDESYFALCYEIDINDNWKNEKTYIKANPNLGSTLELDTLITERDRAINAPHLEREFRTKNLNQWLIGHENGWIADTKWLVSISNYDKYKDYITEDKLATYQACIGLDLSKRTDFTAFTIAFYIPEIKKYYLKHKIFIPENQIEIKIKRDSHLVWKWIKDGLIIPTNGDSIDYVIVEEHLKEALTKYKVKDVAYDPYCARDIIDSLSKIIDTVEFQQKYQMMSEPIKELEQQILNGNIIDGNECMRWMVQNVTVSYFNNCVKLNKENRDSPKRIDAVITSVMAVNRLQINLKTKPKLKIDYKALADSI